MLKLTSNLSFFSYHRVSDNRHVCMMQSLLQGHAYTACDLWLLLYENACSSFFLLLLLFLCCQGGTGQRVIFWGKFLAESGSAQLVRFGAMREGMFRDDILRWLRKKLESVSPFSPNLFYIFSILLSEILFLI